MLYEVNVVLESGKGYKLVRSGSRIRNPGPPCMGTAVELTSPKVVL